MPPFPLCMLERERTDCPGLGQRTQEKQKQFASLKKCLPLSSACLQMCSRVSYTGVSVHRGRGGIVFVEQASCSINNGLTFPSALWAPSGEQLERSEGGSILLHLAMKQDVASLCPALPSLIQCLIRLGRRQHPAPST